MEITIKWFDKSFNVCIASAAGKEPFLEVKSCRLVAGKDGEFVSTPSTKNEKTGKYWNHAYFSKEFADVVLKKAKESQPMHIEREPAKQSNSDPFDDTPF